ARPSCGDFVLSSLPPLPNGLGTPVTRAATHDGSSGQSAPIRTSSIEVMRERRCSDLGFFGPVTQHEPNQCGQTSGVALAKMGTPSFGGAGGASRSTGRPTPLPPISEPPRLAPVNAGRSCLSGTPGTPAR